MCECFDCDLLLEVRCVHTQRVSYLGPFRTLDFQIRDAQCVLTFLGGLKLKRLIRSIVPYPKFQYHKSSGNQEFYYKFGIKTHLWQNLIVIHLRLFLLIIVIWLRMIIHVLFRYYKYIWLWDMILGCPELLVMHRFCFPKFWKILSSEAFKVNDCGPGCV